MLHFDAKISRSLRGSRNEAGDLGKWVPAALLTTALALGALVPEAGAEEEEIPFSVAQVLIQLNDTDGDLGFHARIDGEPWKRVKIEDPRERVIFDVRTRGRLRRQGLTEFAFESAEPTFDVLTPEEFFRRFPQGEYEIEGKTLAGKDLESTSVFTHIVPAAPVLLGPSPAGCDQPEVFEPDEEVTISWEAVTTTHAEIGVFDPDVEVDRYIVTVEREEPEPVFRFDIDVPAGETELEIPDDFLEQGTLFKYQVLVVESRGNETSAESCFEISG